MYGKRAARKAARFFYACIQPFDALLDCDGACSCCADVIVVDGTHHHISALTSNTPMANVMNTARSTRWLG